MHLIKRHICGYLLDGYRKARFCHNYSLKRRCFRDFTPYFASIYRHWLDITVIIYWGIFHGFLCNWIPSVEEFSAAGSLVFNICIFFLYSGKRVDQGGTVTKSHAYEDLGLVHSTAPHYEFTARGDGNGGINHLNSSYGHLTSNQKLLIRT